MKWMLFLISLLAIDTAIAAPRVNNGGGGWACRKNDGTGKVIWIKSADLTKVEFYMARGLKEKEGNVWDLLHEQRKYIKDVLPNLDAILTEKILPIGSSLVAMDGALSYIPDAELLYKPPATSCPGGLVSYVQLATATMDGKILYSTRVWDTYEFSSYQKAAVLLHEQIYFALRKKFGDESSYRTRQIIGLIYTGLEESELRRQVDEVLSDLPRSETGIFGFTNTPALFNVDVTCSIELNDDQNIFTWKPGVDQNEHLYNQGGFEFSVRTWMVDGSPMRLQIKDLETKISTIVEIPDAIPMFNATGRVQAFLKGEKRKARLRCESRSSLDRDPL
ncbi:hypothetical protein [Bdellovibrio sp. HCB209]|uniref:hypothetical protein n=1 Tax=Bdellovibrio sp. HCB209 TaxID=3394354 RepID=UPI0039B6215D